MQDKNQLRQKHLLLLRSMPEALKAKASQAVQQAILTNLTGERHIAAYWSFGNEVSITEIFDQLASNGSKIYLPKMQAQQLGLALYEPEKMQKNTYNFLEPSSGTLAELSKLDLVYLPLIAFDTTGSRLGRGQGHYDRLLQTVRLVAPQARCIGIAYEWQKVSHVPTETHDVPLDGVMTEQRYYAFKQV